MVKMNEEIHKFSEISETGISRAISKYTYLEEDYLCFKHSRFITLKRKNNTKPMSYSAWSSNIEHRKIFNLSLLLNVTQVSPDGDEGQGVSHKKIAEILSYLSGTKKERFWYLLGYWASQGPQRQLELCCLLGHWAEKHISNDYSPK